MDKFGIFKLLNSFFDYYKENKKDLPENINAIFNGLTGKPEEKPVDKNTKAPEIKPMPLQHKMLSTIKSHDELVKRVLEKQKSKN